MMSRRFAVLCISAAIALWSCTNDADGQLTDEKAHELAELAELVQHRRAQIQTIDLTYTSLVEVAHSQMSAPSNDPNWRAVNMEIVHVKYQGERFFWESRGWRDPGRDPSHHFVSTYDGEKSITYNVLARTASIAAKYSAPWPRDRFHSCLRWSRALEHRNHPRRDLTTLITRQTCHSLTTGTAQGAETVVLDCGLDKVWLDVEHGGVLRRIEARRSVDGPLFSRVDVAEVRDIEGVFFPTKIVKLRFVDETSAPKRMWNTPVKRLTSTVAEDGLKINCDLTPEDFDVQLPPGTRIIGRPNRIQRIDEVTSAEP